MGIVLEEKRTIGERIFRMSRRRRSGAVIGNKLNRLLSKCEILMNNRWSHRTVESDRGHGIGGGVCRDGGAMGGREFGMNSKNLQKFVQIMEKMRDE